MKNENLLMPLYIINLKERKDRLEHIKGQMQDRNEFSVFIKEAIKHETGALGLWNTLVTIVKEARSKEEKFIIICEDDHLFTDCYNATLLRKAIVEAGDKEADLLSGGVSWFHTALQISSDLFWVDRFTGLQFTVIYSKFFNAILDATFEPTDAADYKLSELTGNKFLLYPFISIQREFGYSDVTEKNNLPGYVTQVFADSLEKLGQLKDVGVFYGLEF
ncbi:hypothetical protein GFS24_17810 [Chitinophaga sp. SYP-B3965]|uniref:hypothetical protein n=1 Tax=Chitinophaga sp. SYP-B3965 TaxID=2663120 RepID=UPI001299AD67|nr:hypothetical protein [Chitinophaga sp. SYP-B3965]MRG46983.1 hypothetical protein [Chitinophaga sp. SYP-B3965]